MANDDAQHYEIACQEVLRHLEDTETSKLAHWYAASVYERRHKLLIAGPATVLAIILTWLLSAPLEKTLPSSVLSYFKEMLPPLLGLIVAILSGLATFLSFNDLASRHRMAAQNYHNLWRHCKNWKTDFPNFLTVKEAVHVVKQYRDRLNEINNNSPQIPKWAWKSVQIQRDEGSTSYIVDKSEQEKIT